MRVRRDYVFCFFCFDGVLENAAKVLLIEGDHDIAFGTSMRWRAVGYEVLLETDGLGR